MKLFVLKAKLGHMFNIHMLVRWVFYVKANFTPDATQRYALNDKDSWEVVKLLQKFPETVMQAAEKYEPSVIAKHSIHLAQAFNKYYAHVRILDEDAQKSTLSVSLCSSYCSKKKIYVY